MITHATEWFGRAGSFLPRALLVLAFIAGFSAPTANGATGPVSGLSGQLQLEGSKAFTVLGCSLAITAASSWTSGSGASVGKPNPEAIRFTKAFDATSIYLLKKITSGHVIASAKFTATSSTGSSITTMVYEMTDLYVTAINHAGAGGAPLEEVSLIYKTLAWKFIDADGVETSGTWNIPEGTVK